MYHEHLDALAKHLCTAGILCLRFTMKTPNFKYRVKCFAAVVVSRLKFKELLICTVCLHAKPPGKVGF